MSVSHRIAPFLLVCAGLTSCRSTEPRQDAPGFTYVYALAPEEGVFAYSRISPDGRYLAYASQARAHQDLPFDRSQLQNVVDLQTNTAIFSEPGIDGYWSPDGTRLIFLSTLGSTNSVSLWDRASGALARDVAPESLGDYFSWGRRDGRDLILTILNRYYYLNGDRAELPAAAVPSCPGMGAGQRPLLSKDGRYATTFVGGAVVVRSLTDCSELWNTGLPGAKADFSFDGRYVAFHAPKPDGIGFEIQVIDRVDRTVRRVTGFSGSSFFPTWTADGRLLFRYDGEDFRGFVMASNVLSARATTIPDRSTTTSGDAAPLVWPAVFPETAEPLEEFALVLVWGPWSAHAPGFLTQFAAARATLARTGANARLMMATDPGSLESDVVQLTASIPVDRTSLPPHSYVRAGAHNQNPTSLLFRRGVLVDRWLGPQAADEIVRWIARHSNSESVGSVDAPSGAFERTDRRPSP